jgi:cell division protein FtsL
MRGENIILMASIITALTVIITTAIKLYKAIKMIATKLHDFQQSIEENTMYTLKLVVLNNELDRQERIDAGKRYLELHGNGFVHAVYDNLVKEAEQENVERANKSNLQ